MAYLEHAVPADVVMLGLTNHDVDDLNERARARLVEAGRLGPAQVALGGRGFRVGDRVVTRHNDYRLGVLNGQRWTVTALEEESRELVLRRDGSQDLLRLPFAYAEVGQGRLQHAYALTTALSQGSTVDRAFVLGSDATYREAGYTAASRARRGTQFYVVRRDPEEGCAERHAHLHVGQVGQDPLEAMAEALSRSGAQHLATDTGATQDPTYVSGNGRQALLEERHALRRLLREAPRHQGRRLAELGRELRAAQAEWERARADRDELAKQEDEAMGRRFWQRRPPRRLDRLTPVQSRETVWARRVDELTAALAQVDRQQTDHERWRERHRQDLDRLQVLERALQPVELARDQRGAATVDLLDGLAL